MADKSSPKTLPIPVNLWTVSTIIVALFLIKATGGNPPEYYTNVRWLTLIVAVIGAWATFRHEHLGWTFGFFGLVVLDWLAALFLTAGAFLVCWDELGERLARVRNAVDTFFLYSIGSVWAGLLVHLAIVIALLPISYAVFQNEDLVDEWQRFRDHHLWAVTAATLVVVVLCFRRVARRTSRNG